MDIRMPVTDGFEVIEYVHKHKLATRIIALTAFDEEAMIFNLMRARVPGILFKKTTHQQEIYTAHQCGDGRETLLSRKSKYCSSFQT